MYVSNDYDNDKICVFLMDFSEWLLWLFHNISSLSAAYLLLFRIAEVYWGN